MTETSQYQSKHRSERGNRWLPALSFGILLLGAVFLGLKWDSIPDRWPVHWGLDGRPNDWSNKNPLGVFLPFAVGMLICGFLEAMALIVRSTAKARASLSAEAAGAIAGLTADFVRVIEIAVSLVFVYMGIALPLSSPANAFRVGWLALVLILGAVGVGMVRMRKGVRALKDAGHSGLEGYNGITYNNRADSRLWVPKISGLGYTLNFAHPWAWPILLAFLALPILGVILLVICS